MPNETRLHGLRSFAECEMNSASACAASSRNMQNRETCGVCAVALCGGFLPWASFLAHPCEGSGVLVSFDPAGTFHRPTTFGDGDLDRHRHFSPCP
jgi:hypothetical protein